MQHSRIIYRVDLGALHCRSAAELVHLKATALEGVEAAGISAEGTLTLLGLADVVTPDDIVRTLIESGIEPVAIEASDVIPANEHVTDEPVIEPQVVSMDEGQPWATPVAQTVIEPADAVAVESAAAEPEKAAPPVAVALQDEVLPSDLRELEESFDHAFEAPVVTSPRASLVQHISVTVSDDYYPNRLEVIPGVPVEIEFSEGHGCLARVLFEQFGIAEDLTDGGATVRLPGLAPGEYGFSCGMRMVFGTVVAA